MYAGLRRGELIALRVNRIDLDANVIHVERGWDVQAGEIATKNGKDRKVPITAPLRELLLPHLLRTGRRGDDLVFGSTATEPFAPKDLTRRADEAWTGLRRITLHECRHTFASYMIAAGVNAKAVSTYMGHASVGFTLDRYGHLFPGAEGEAEGLLDTYLQAAEGQGS
jgi:integrase